MSACTEELPKRWLFSKEEILNAPSVQNGVAVTEVMINVR